MATYLYFKPSGKWKYEGEGVSIPDNIFRLTHDTIKVINGGQMPGISSDGKYLTIVVIDEESWPRLIPAEETSP